MYKCLYFSVYRVSFFEVETESVNIMLTMPGDTSNYNYLTTPITPELMNYQLSNWSSNFENRVKYNCNVTMTKFSMVQTRVEISLN